ncbi:monocarboxylate transporter 10-like isoform X2 [Cloeon dipterum]
MLGLKRTTLVGGSLAVIGMTLSSFLTHTVEALCVTYGIIFGIGASLAYTPSLAVLGLHFREKLGLVNGIVCTGSSVFTIALPPILSFLLQEGDLPWALRFLAICMAGLAAASFLFTPPKGSQATAEKSPTTKKQSIINRDNWRVKRYVIWTICIPCSLFGYFVPYVHMVKFVDERFPTEDGKILIMCIGLTSGLGRLIFGKIGDLPRVDRILLQQVSFISMGALTMLMVWAPTWPWMVALVLGIGIFDGCFISLIGPIAFDLCGPQGASQAIGFLLGLMSIPMTLGPPLAGMLYDKTSSYQLAFLLSGLPSILGGLALTAMHCFKTEKADPEQKGPEAASLIELRVQPDK